MQPSMGDLDRLQKDDTQGSGKTLWREGQTAKLKH